MAGESAPHTLQATALVHEAYLRLVGDERTRWQNRRHFYAAAAEAMRRILIERARRRSRIRHGGGLTRIPFQDEEVSGPARDPRVLSLDAALRRLEAMHPRKAEVVKLRYFIGLTIQETAETLGVSPATVKLDWSFSRAWLHREIERSVPDSASADSARFGA
jgi:RNA polymerase sigma factor (TIGR02999 family)